MEEKIKKISNDEFKILAGILIDTYRKFYFRKIAQEKIGTEIDGRIWKNFQEIWTHIIVSLRHYYLSNLAKIFDKPSYPVIKDRIKVGEKITLSIFRAISFDKFSKDNSETIEKIRTLRKEIVAHLEAEKVSQGKMCEQDYGLNLDGEQIKSLIGNTFELLNQIREEFDYTEELNQVKEEEHIQKIFNEWYNVFEKEYNIKI